LRPLRALRETYPLLLCVFAGSISLFSFLSQAISSWLFPIGVIRFICGRNLLEI